MPKHQLLFTALLCAGLTFGGCSQPVFMEGNDTTEANQPTDVNYDEHDYDLLNWQGEMEKFRFEDNGTIRLYDPNGEKSTAYLSASLSTPDRTCWQIHVRLSFNPSANNHTRLYLMADTPDLTSGLNGYFLQVGDEEDCVYFYRQQGQSLTLLYKTGAFMKGDSSPDVCLKVERDKQGYFLLYIAKTFNYSQPLAIIKDNTITTATHCGILCTYTASNSRKMCFPVFRIHHDVYDVEELQPVTSSITPASIPADH